MFYLPSKNKKTIRFILYEVLKFVALMFNLYLTHLKQGFTQFEIRCIIGSISTEKIKQKYHY